MALKKFNPTTPGQRQLVMVDRSALYKGKHSSGGRNNTGRMVVRFRGGGHKQTYRIVDFKRTKVDMPATVERLEYDPNRTAFIALVKYTDGTQAYILAPRQRGQPQAARQQADRHHHPQCGIEDRQGRPARAFRRHLRPARRPRP